MAEDYHVLFISEVNQQINCRKEKVCLPYVLKANSYLKNKYGLKGADSERKAIGYYQLGHGITKLWEIKKGHQTMRKMILLNVLISIALSFSCAKEPQKETSVSLLTKEKLKNSYIQLIPSHGILLDSDSILIGETGIADLLTKLDTNSIKCKLTIDRPKQLVMMTMDSPPPGYTGEYKHQPDEYFTVYSSTLQCDSLTFCFYYNSKGQTVIDKNIYMDSLRINSIGIKMPLNAGLFEDLKIGDSYEQIFKHFKKPEYFNQLDMYKKEIKFTGVVFTIETDKSKVENYGRIIKIEINNLMEY